MNDSPALAQLRQTYSGLPIKGQKYAPVPLGLTLSLGSNHSLGLDSSCHLPKSPPVGSTADDGFMESRESAVENINESGKLTTGLHPTKLRLQHSFPSFPIESNSPRQPLCHIDTESNNSIGITSDTLGNKKVLEGDSSCQERPNIAGPRKKKPYKELTLEEKVELIRLAEKNTNLSQATIAERYCIAKSNVCRILQRKNEYLSAYESAGFAGSRKRKLRSVGDQQLKENNSKTTEQAKKTLENCGANEDMEHKKSALENGDESVRSHMYRHHQLSRVSVCRCCNFAFPDKAALLSHIQSRQRSSSCSRPVPKLPDKQSEYRRSTVIDSNFKSSTLIEHPSSPIAHPQPKRFASQNEISHIQTAEQPPVIRPLAALNWLRKEAWDSIRNNAFGSLLAQTHAGVSNVVTQSPSIASSASTGGRNLLKQDSQSPAEAMEAGTGSSNLSTKGITASSLFPSQLLMPMQASSGNGNVWSNILDRVNISGLTSNTQVINTGQSDAEDGPVIDVEGEESQQPSNIEKNTSSEFGNGVTLSPSQQTDTTASSASSTMSPTGSGKSEKAEGSRDAASTGCDQCRYQEARIQALVYLNSGLQNEVVHLTNKTIAVGQCAQQTGIENSQLKEHNNLLRLKLLECRQKALLLIQTCEERNIDGGIGAGTPLSQFIGDLLNITFV